MEEVSLSRVIAAAPDVVWACLRDFNGLPDWHPAIADSVIEADRASDAVGCIRSFHLNDGGHIREQLVELSDVDRRMVYIILESPMPITDYRARIEIVPVTEDEASLVIWSARFEVAPADAAATVETVADGVFRAGLAALAQKLE